MFNMKSIIIFSLIFHVILVQFIALLSSVVSAVNDIDLALHKVVTVFA